MSVSFIHEHVDFRDTTDVLGDLVSRSLETDIDGAIELVMALRGQGLSPETIYADLFEPAARRLGDLWQDDRCSEFDIAIALSRLQSLARRLGDDFQHSRRTSTRRRSVLLSTLPGKARILALTLSSEYFWHAGWEVTCAFPDSDAELCDLLRNDQFDVLDLSLSSVFREDDRLHSMAGSVQAARGASARSKLIVLVSGRIFAESAEASFFVGADAGCTTSAQSVSLAERLSDALAATGFSTAQQTLRTVGKQIAAAEFHQRSLERTRYAYGGR